VNPRNGFVDHLTVDELKKIWQPGSTVRRWNDIRPGWPDREIHLYGPGTDSGTFDYFTEAINGGSGRCRADFTASEDDNVLVRGISGDPDALGFFGFAYYVENASRLKVVPIGQGGAAAVAPSMETIGDGTYQPLARPIFIYVSKASAARPEVEAFVHFYLESAPSLVGEVGYVPLPDRAYELGRTRFDRGVTGSIFGGHGAQVGVKIEDLLQRSQ
jgi:phosphate transport system substrate-binding protein